MNPSRVGKYMCQTITWPRYPRNIQFIFHIKQSNSFDSSKHTRGQCLCCAPLASTQLHNPNKSHRYPFKPLISNVFGQQNLNKFIYRNTKEENLRIEKLPGVPPVPGIENQDIGIDPSPTDLVQSIQFKRRPDPLGSILGRPVVLYQENRPVELHRQVIGAKPHRKMSNLLRDSAPINLIHTLLLLDASHEHAHKRFPLGAAHGIANEHDPFAAKGAQSLPRVEPRQVTLPGLPPPVLIIPIPPAVGDAVKSFFDKGAVGGVVERVGESVGDPRTVEDVAVGRWWGGREEVAGSDGYEDVEEEAAEDEEEEEGLGDG